MSLGCYCILFYSFHRNARFLIRESQVNYCQLNDLFCFSKVRNSKLQSYFLLIVLIIETMSSFSLLISTLVLTCRGKWKFYIFLLKNCAYKHYFHPNFLSLLYTFYQLFKKSSKKSKTRKKNSFPKVVFRN